MKQLTLTKRVENIELIRKAQAPWSAPTGKCSSALKVCLSTFNAEGYLTPRG